MRTTDTERLEARAAAEAEAGNLAYAAGLYRQLAAASIGARSIEYLLEGVGLAVRGGDHGTARRWLAEAGGGASAEQRQRILYWRAEIEVAAREPGAALATLASIPPPMAPALLRDAAATRGKALFQLARHEEAVRELVERELWLGSSDEILDNQRLIWDGLRQYAVGALFDTTGDPIVDGWLALAPLAFAADEDFSNLREELLGWREAYPNHPAAGALLAQLLAQGRRRGGFPQQIALLLPLSSLAMQQAVALRDGFVAAHLSDPNGPRAQLRVYDTTLLGSAEAYLQAQLEGADFIVGPLLRNEVELIAGQAGFVPTLALNFAQTPIESARSFFQFALAPEDEARAAARHAIGSGAQTALALIPSDDWGLRLLDGFRAEFEQLGGRLLQFSGYDPNAQDFSLPITSLLNITRSNQRRQRLAANLGVAVEFEPRRRQDVDVLFIAADAHTARLIAPQLRFHYAGDIPSYATSEIYEPGNRFSDSDLNGLTFADTPWLLVPDRASTALKRELEAYWPQRATRWLRLYGMGFDAYHLVSLLYAAPGTLADSSPVLQGMSGQLTLAPDGRIHRLLPLAQFRDGRPVALATEEDALADLARRE